MAKNNVLELGFLFLVILVFVIYVFLKRSSSPDTSISTSTPSEDLTSGGVSGSALKCLPSTLPFEPGKHGSANIIVSSRYHYDPVTETTVCCVLDVQVDVTGALPKDYFEVYVNYVYLYASGGTGEVGTWNKISSGTTDNNGNLTLSFGISNPSGSGGLQVVVGIADSSCSNLLITQLPNILCSRDECLKQYKQQYR